MFKVNDYVVYSSTVCQITDIAKDKSGNSDETDYYILHPVYNDNITIKTPINGPNLIRQIITKDDVLALIAAMPEMEICWIDGDKQRSFKFKAALRTGKNEERIKIIKTLHLAREARANKKLTKTDENIMNTAEKQLYEEFSIALNIKPDEVLPYILEHISSTEEWLKNYQGGIQNEI